MFLFKNKSFRSSLKNILGFYPFKISLYHQAFRHRSAASSNQKESASNERLEYLGDAILGAVVADYLFKRFPFRDEGFLTEMRSKIVSRENLNKLAIRLGVRELIEIAEDNNPKNKSINGDAFEALIGAIYLDRGYPYARKFLLNRIIKHHVDVDELESQDNNFKSKLIEWAQRERKSVTFEVVQEIGTQRSKQLKVEVRINGEVKGFGIDFSKKKAEQIAAAIVCKEMHI